MKFSSGIFVTCNTTGERFSFSCDRARTTHLSGSTLVAHALTSMLGITNTVFARVSQPCSGARAKRRADRVLACSSVENGKSGSEEAHNGSGSGGVGAGDLLGPIGLSLGPIGMSLGASKQRNGAVSADQEADNEAAAAERVRLNALSTDEWKRTHVRPGALLEHTYLFCAY